MGERTCQRDRIPLNDRHVVVGWSMRDAGRQLPKRLPLDPRAETPIRADAVSICYRRWLRERAVTYGAIPAGA